MAGFEDFEGLQSGLVPEVDGGVVAELAAGEALQGAAVGQAGDAAAVLAVDFLGVLRD